MRSPALAAATALCALGVGLAAACTNTGSTTFNPLDTYEPPPAGRDTPPAGSDPAPPSGDPSGAGGARGLPLCMNPPTDVAPCIACAQASCGSEIASVVGNCSDFLNCYDQCDCSDSSCITSCEGDITSQCDTSASPLASCLTNECANACGDSTTVTFGEDGGTGDNDGGTTITVEPGSGTGAGSGGSCSSLASCCGSLSGPESTECNDVVASNDDTACSSTLTELQGVSLCK